MPPRKQNFRAPFRPANLAQWDKIKRQVLEMWAEGYSPGEIGQRIRRERMPDQAAPPGVAARTARQYFRRIYDEYQLPPERRTPAAAVTHAYRVGDLPCPHPGPAAFAARLAEAQEQVRVLQMPRRRASRAPTRVVTPAAPTGAETYLDRINRIRGGSGKV